MSNRNNILILQPKKKIVAIFWDGTFQQARKLHESNIFEGLQMSTWEGQLSYVDSKGKLCAIPRRTWILRDGDVKYYFANNSITDEYEICSST
jgi:hypothetical protein